MSSCAEGILELPQLNISGRFLYTYPLKHREIKKATLHLFVSLFPIFFTNAQILNRMLPEAERGNSENQEEINRYEDLFPLRLISG